MIERFGSWLYAMISLLAGVLMIVVLYQGIERFITKKSFADPWYVLVLYALFGVCCIIVGIREVIKIELVKNKNLK